MNPTRGQLPEVELHLRHHTPSRIPARGLVEEALVPHHWFVARSSHGARQQLRDVALQATVIRGYADGILHASPLQRLVNLRLGKIGIGAEHLPYPVLVGAQSPAVTVRPSLPHYARCRAAASQPDSRPR